MRGGHSQFLDVQGLGKYKRLGTTIDDALGEAFDKTAKLLGIEFPGGPQIEILAEKGDPNKYELPKPIINKGGCNLSFAGLKTAVARAYEGSDKTDKARADLSASFQKTVCEVLQDRTRVAMTLFKDGLNQDDLKDSPHRFVVAGGVAANQDIRNALDHLCANEGFTLMAPPLKFCTDNAAMIGIVGLLRLKSGESSPQDLAPSPRAIL